MLKYTFLQPAPLSLSARSLPTDLGYARAALRGQNVEASTHSLLSLGFGSNVLTVDLHGREGEDVVASRQRENHVDYVMCASPQPTWMDHHAVQGAAVAVGRLGTLSQRSCSLAEYSPCSLFFLHPSRSQRLVPQLLSPLCH